jgi:outer membrane protein assembly factor BamB
MIAVFALPTKPPLRGEDWPRWRGAHMDGVSRETGLLDEWPKEGPRQLWKAELSGGHSSIAVAAGRVFTLTVDKPKKQEIVVCLEAATGKELWRFRYDCDYSAHSTLTGGGKIPGRWLSGPRSTPTVDGDYVYALGLTGLLHCLETKTGKKVWQKNLMEMAARDCPRNGYCTCPLIVGDLLFVAPGGKKGKALAALDKKTGKVVWHALSDVLSPSSPIAVTVKGALQVIFFTGGAAGSTSGGRLVALNPKDGKVLWRFPWQTEHHLNVATPLYADGKVFISSGYGKGAALVEIPNDGKAKPLWKSALMKNHFSTSVFYQGNLYGFGDDRLRCLDLATGKQRWTKPGLGKGTLLAADGKLIVLGEHGELVLAKASPEKFSEISRCQLFDRASLTWIAPVLSDGRLFVRNDKLLLALDVSGRKK